MLDGGKHMARSGVHWRSLKGYDKVRLLQVPLSPGRAKMSFGIEID